MFPNFSQVRYLYILMLLLIINIDFKTKRVNWQHSKCTNNSKLYFPAQHMNKHKTKYKNMKPFSPPLSCQAYLFFFSVDTYAVSCILHQFPQQYQCRHAIMCNTFLGHNQLRTTESLKNYQIQLSQINCHQNVYVKV